MIERFGPWSSALNDGLSPHLSTFWRSRLTQLAAVRAARESLTRRDWLKLGAVGTAACALPTLHLAAADGQDDVKPAFTGKIYVYADLKTGAGADGSERGVFAIDPRTAAWTRISDFEGNVRVSRDGRRLALIRASKSADGHDIDGVGVWTIDSEGNGEKTRVADFGGVTSWSPDGKQLIVVKWLGKPSEDGMRHETWRFNADGTGATKLPIPETDEVDDWSPDGQWFATSSDRHPPHGRGYQLYLMRPDGTDERRLTEGRGLNVYPRFSPDSRRVAYLHQERGLNSLWVVDIDVTGRREVYREENDTSPGQFCWSPDGKSLAYELEDWQRDEMGKKFSGYPEKANMRIEITDADGNNRRPLSLPRARWIGAPDWQGMP
jgi:Tol biopolymer transport system component